MDNKIEERFATSVARFGDGETQFVPAQVIAKIGPPLGEMGQKGGRFYFPIFITYVLLLCTVAMTWIGTRMFMDKSGQFTVLGILIFGCVVGCCLWCALWWRKLLWRKFHFVFFCRDGFYWCLGRMAEAWRWDSVMSVKECVAHVERLVIHLPVVFVSRSERIDYYVENSDGAILHFEHDKFAEPKRFRGHLEKECVTRGIPYEIVHNSQRKL